MLVAVSQDRSSHKRCCGLTVATEARILDPCSVAVPKASASMAADLESDGRVAVSGRDHHCGSLESEDRLHFGMVEHRRY